MKKIHEEMISIADSLNTFELKSLFVIVDPSNKKLNKKYKKFHKMKSINSYNSYDNHDYLNQAQLKKIINNYIKKV